MPRQSELVLQPPQRPLEHVPVLQSELVLHAPQRPPEHVPWPLQSDVVLHEPHLPLEHLPNPAQSELVLHSASARGARSSSIVNVGSISTRSPANVGTGVGLTTSLESPPQAATTTANARIRRFMDTGHKPRSRAAPLSDVALCEHHVPPRLLTRPRRQSDWLGADWVCAGQRTPGSCGILDPPPPSESAFARRIRWSARCLGGVA